MTAYREARRSLRRTRRRASVEGRRHARTLRRHARHAWFRARREVRPLQRELEAFPRQARRSSQVWTRQVKADARRGDLRAVAVLLLTITFALLPLQNLRLTSGVAFADVALLGAALVALASRHPRPAASPLPALIRYGALLMAVGGAVGLIFADERLTSAKLLVRLLAVAALAGVAILRVAPSGREVRRFLIGFVVVGAVSGGLSALGDLTGAPLLDRSTFGDRAVGLTVLPYPMLDYLRGTTATAASIAINPNLFGGVSAVAGAAALVLLVETAGWRMRAVLGAAAAGLALGVLFSGSRSALVALVVGGVPAVWRLVRQGHGRRVLLGAAALGVVGALALTATVEAPSLDRLLLRSGSAESERSAESTIKRYQNATRGLEARGWHSLASGSGLRDDVAAKLHDGHLEIWVGLGLVGLVGWLLLCAGVIEGGVRYAGRAGPLGATEVALLAVGSAFAANVTVTFFVDTLWNRYIWLLVALAVSLMIRPHGVERAATAAPVPAPAREDEPRDGVEPELVGV
ncbi:MAG: hypothetical protein KDB10_06455 [Acidimicrobiales bacterium]|nr:hypothetical protein [Acidimicrobiales bacterium]